MNQIKIQIIGTAGSGKSTLAWEIADLMKELGLVVSVKDHETDIPEIQVERSLSLYKKDINIAIFGLGTVGSSLVKLITREKKRISNSLNLNLNLIAISSRKLPLTLLKYKKIFTKKK